ncbi:MAG TPA: NAD(P)/FAD-dependent oxidoreductase [Candidatus Binataceae bacterium]|nr:NAD(P)/FAD-dependent oxidoreductase [Candidatus Binataceae bacterium]
MRIAIVGGGPAGLTAAIAARRLGLEPLVFEQARDFRRIGGGILIHSNGLRVLDALGLYRGFAARMNTVQKLFSVLPEGCVVGSVDYADLAIPFNRCAVVMRYELQEYLLSEAQCAGVKIEFGQRLMGFASNNGRGELEFESGMACEADVVLACDGYRSATRAAAGIAAKVIDINQAYLRGIAERSVDKSSIRELWGVDGRRFGICPLPGERTYFFCNAPPGGWEETRSEHLNEWIAGWSAFGDEVAGLLNSVADWSRVNYDELHEIRCREWARPPVFVVGDAAHAMTPNLGQGANSAMVDAIVLVRLLAEAAEYGASLAEVAATYQEIRQRFATRIQTTARWMGSMASYKSGLARTARNRAMGLMQSRKTMRSAALVGAGYNPLEERFLRSIS